MTETAVKQPKTIGQQRAEAAYNAATMRAFVAKVTRKPRRK